VNPLILPVVYYEDYCKMGVDRNACGETSLEQNRPSPFNPTTTVVFNLPRAAHATLTVYDASRVVKTLRTPTWRRRAPRRVGRHGRERRQSREWSLLLRGCVGLLDESEEAGSDLLMPG
jgi:hypothetical protein